GALVDVDVGDPELGALVEVAPRHRIGHLPTLGIAPPLRRVELAALDVPAVDLLLEGLQPLLAVARVPGGVEDEAVGILLLEDGVAGRRVEALVVEVSQVGREEDRLVDVAVLEEVLHQVFFAVGAVLLKRPDVFLGTQRAVVAVEAPDPALAVLLVAPVFRGRIPPVHVAVNDEILLAVLLVHRAPLSPRSVLSDRRTVCPSPPLGPAKKSA